MRRDLTHLRVFTVDDAGTTEVWTGSSWRQTQMRNNLAP
jgi:exoribonuclease R